MATQSARQAGDRPFYSAYGRAYDLLITHPVQPWTDLVSAALDNAGIAAPARDPRGWLRHRPACR